MWRVILREGVASVSVRSVAGEAALSTGSLRHIFPGQTELLVSALELVQENVRDRILALPEALTGLARAIAIAIARELLPLDRERAVELEVQLSLAALAFSNPALRRVRDGADAAVLFACQRMLALIDHEYPLRNGVDPELEARLLHALLDGLAAHLIQDSHLLTAVDALTILERHLSSLSTHDRTSAPPTKEYQ